MYTDNSVEREKRHRLLFIAKKGLKRGGMEDSLYVTQTHYSMQTRSRAQKIKDIYEKSHEKNIVLQIQLLAIRH